MSDFDAIFTEAKLAAKTAAAEMYKKIGGDRLCCGFAWVRIDDGRSPFVRWLREQSKKNPDLYGEKSDTKGWEIYNPSDHPCQNIDTKEAGAKAFVAVLRQHGIVAYAKSRLD